jgi:hypothetical protein
MLSHIAPRLLVRTTTLVASVSLLALSLSAPVMAKPQDGPPGQQNNQNNNNQNSMPPSVMNTIAGVLQNDPLGGYLWEYSVYGGKSPALSHWVLDICPDIFNDIIEGSVVGGPFEFRPESSPDPSFDDYDAIGLKFDSGTQDDQTKIYSFRTSQEWLPTTTTAFFKSGQNEKIQTGVIAPDCEMNGNPPPPPVVPEPGTMALLVCGCAPLAAGLRRRFRRQA